MKTIFRLLFLFGFLLFISTLCTFSQISVNNDGSSPDPSAGLDVKFTNKGFLPPRVALTAINSATPLISPATGLLVYNTATAGIFPNNVIPGNYYWNGSRWISVSPPQGVNIGDMLYWNSRQWDIVPAGSSGQILNFNDGIPTWGGVQIPIISTVVVTAIAQTNATSGGNMTSDGGAPVTARGVCWSTSPNPTTANSSTIDGSGTGSYVSNLTGLTANTHYFIRAYASNSSGTFYGNQLGFTTLSFSIGQSYQGGIIFYINATGQNGLIASTIDQSTSNPWGCYGTLIGGTSTAIGTGQANTTAIVNGCDWSIAAAHICDDLLLNGYSDWFLPSKDELNQMYIQRSVLDSISSGVFWSSSEYNAYYAYYQDFSNGSQYYVNKNSAYHVRAIRAFPSAVTLPSISTTPVSMITQNTAYSGAHLISDGGAPVTAMGLCWSTTPNPTTTNNHTTNTDEPTFYICNLTGLTANTLYYIRAYATNNVGTSYGNQLSFTTLSFTIGVSYQGGIIFYLDGTGQHGLIAAPTDQSVGIQWYNGSYTTTNAVRDQVNAGQFNTERIIINQGAGSYAAQICANYQGGGYGDWYLPSKSELDLMYVNLHLAGFGGFTDSYYWSSSEFSLYYAWSEYFYTRSQASDPKGNSYNVRAVRAF